ncbi:MAG: NAD-dependent epimerase/dehydratase family protein [Planctomycetales bacterium]|nr:NAD-dependent epimerase/dehydratase family protein [Planctomycetales bacterium]
MKILITGICGFVGSVLAESLAASAQVDAIVGIDNLSRAGSERNVARLKELGVEVRRGDIRNASDLDAIDRVDWLIDAAANPSVLAGVDGKTSSRQLVEHNLVGTVNMLEFCRRHQATFTLLSTSRVYSIAPLAALRVEESAGAFRPIADQEFPAGLSPRGVSEEFSTEPPVSLYGSTKVCSEHLALEYGAAFDFPVWINRCGVMAGAGQFGHPAQGIFSYWIHSFRERRPLKYIGFGGAGRQVRDCLHPRDLVPLLLAQCASAAGGDQSRIVNVSGGVENSISLAQLTSWCEQRFEPLPIESVPQGRRFDLPWVVLDPSRAQSQWKWQPATSINETLAEIADFADAEPHWLALSC